MGIKASMCIRVGIRMECPDCGYPQSEAMYSLLHKVPHGNPPCRINCSGGCPVCAPEEHQVDCVAMYASQYKNDCMCNKITWNMRKAFVAWARMN